MTDETIKLILQVAGADSIETLRKSTANYKSLLEDLIQQWRRGDLTTEELIAAQTKYGRELEKEKGILAALEDAQAEQVRQANRQVDALAALGIRLEAAEDKQQRLGKATAGTTKGLGGLQQQIIAGSYMLQDFTATSGDLGAKLNSISNNLPSLLAGLGGLGTVISIGATGAIAFYRNWDTLTRLFEEKNPFPDATQDVESMRRELDRAKDAMAKLEENAGLTESELKKYNELRGKTAQIEERIAAAEERQEVLKKLKGLKDADQDAEAKARAEALQKDLGGQQDALTRSVARALNTENDQQRNALETRYQQLTEQANNATGEEQRQILAQLRQLKDQMARIPTEADRMAEARGIVGNAVIRGDLASFRGLQDQAIRRPDLFTDAQRAAINRQESPETPEKKKQKEDDEKIAEAKRKEAQKLQDANAAIDADNKRQSEAGLKLIEAKEQQAKKLANDETRARVKRQVAGEDAGIQAGGYDVMAERELARLRAQGGEFDRNGRFHRMSEDQIFDLVQQRLSGVLRQRNPRMDAGRRDDIATRAVAGANEELEKMLGLNANVVENQALLANRVMQIDAKLMQVAGRARDVHRALQAPGPPNLDMGR